MAELVVTVLLFGMFALVLYRAVERRQKAERRQKERAEDERLQACGQVVLSYANHLGYIAKQVISRNELDELIEHGISAEELAGEIGSRIHAVDGITLGYQGLQGSRIEVKLTQEFRDRH